MPIIIPETSGEGFTQVPVSGIVNLSNAENAAGAVVTFTLSEPISDGAQVVVPETLSAKCASNGTFAITLNANTDETTSPLGTYYSVQVMYEGEPVSSLNVVVPSSGAGGVDLFSLNPPA